MFDELKKIRRIKSYVLRQGKITSGQEDAMTNLYPIYGVEYKKELLNLDSSKKHIIEIGFGMGGATCEIAFNNPSLNYLGIEVHSPGVGAILMNIKQQNLTNLKVIHYDAIFVLKDMIMDNSIDGFHIFFPDPWHKKKHHKRRLIQDEFVDLLVSKLKVDGYIHFATDWESYAYHSLEVFNKNPLLENTSSNNNFVPRPEYRPMTKFENRGIKLGHQVFDLIFKKKHAV